jgi:hypothetical protein
LKYLSIIDIIGYRRNNIGIFHVESANESERLDEDEKRKEGKIWLDRIDNAQTFAQDYYLQAYTAYRLYNQTFNDVKINSRTFSVESETLKSLISLDGGGFAGSLRSDLFYANIETLASLVLPDVPNVKINLKNQYSYGYNSNQQFNDLAIALLQDVVRFFIKQSLTKMTFKKFKLDYFVTGQGILWVDYATTEVPDKLIESIDIDYVHWLNFAMDAKPEWADVRWVARRHFLDKAQMKSLYPKLNFEDVAFESNPWADMGRSLSFKEIDFTYKTSGAKYVAVWEIWDKRTRAKILVSDQYNNKLLSYNKIENVPKRHFFPTPQPPLAIINGLNLKPSSEVWAYFNELKQLSFISERKEQLLRSLMLKGYSSKMYMDAVADLNNAQDKDIVLVDNLDGANPDFVRYLDNRPKVEMLNALSQEHELLKNYIYEITGISDQMRNISPVSENPNEETATEVKAKTIFGSRRLREKQDVLVSYLRQIYENVVYKTCSLIDKGTFKQITSLNIADNHSKDLEKLMGQRQEASARLEQLKNIVNSYQQQGSYQPQSGQQQQQATQQGAVSPGSPYQQGSQQASQLQQPNQQQQPQQQANQQQGSQQQQGNQQQPNQLQQVNQEIQNITQSIAQINAQEQKLKDEPTWDRIINFFKTSILSCIDIDVELDDMNSFLEKNQLSQKLMNDNMGLMNSMTQIMQLSMQNPDFADSFTEILNSMVNNSLYDVTQKRSVQNFVAALRQKINEIKKNPPPPPPPPTPEDIKAQAAQLQAQARMTEAQAKAALDNARIQDTQSEATRAQSSMILAQARAMEAQSKIASAQNASQADSDINAKAALDERKEAIKHAQEVEKLKMQIASQDNRAKDKLMTDEHLAKLKIAADDNRTQERIKADIVKQKMKQKQDQAKASLEAAKEAISQIDPEL